MQLQDKQFAIVAQLWQMSVGAVFVQHVTCREGDVKKGVQRSKAWHMAHSCM
jgi:hypothetical protein